MDAGKCFLVMSLVFLWCVISPYLFMAEQKQTDYTLPTGRINAFEILQGDIVQQTISIQGHIDDLSILLANGGGNRAQTNWGTISFSLRQDETVKEGVLDIAGIEDWVYVEIPVDLSVFADGEATLEIRSMDTQSGSSIFLPYELDDIYEIPPAQYNGASLGGALCLQYTTGAEADSSHFYMFAGLSFLACMIIAGLLVYYPKDRWIYAMTSVLIFCVIALRYPSYTVGGEAWAEVGNLYLPSARDHSFISNLFTLEAGLYVNALGRLLTWAMVKLLPSPYAAVMGLNLISLGLVSIMGAALSSGVLKKYISPLMSVVLSVLLTTCMVDAETVATPLITSYWAIVPLVLLLSVFVLQIQLPRKLFALWAGLIVLAIFSRMSYVIFIPILLMYGIWYRKSLTKQQKVFISILGVCCLAEGVISLLLRSLEGVEGAGSIHLEDPIFLLNALLYYQVQVLNTIFRLPASSHMLTWNLLCLAVLICFIVGMLLWIIREKHSNFAKGVLLLLAISFGQCCLLLITEGFTPTSGRIDWDLSASLGRNRQWMFCLFAYFAILLTSYGYWMEIACQQGEKIGRRGCFMAVCFLLAGLFSVHNYPISAATFLNPNNDLGDWDSYSLMAERDAYLIPFAPGGLWMDSKNCLIEQGTTSFAKELSLDLDTDCVVSVYVTRARKTNQLSLRPYFINLYDGAGNLVATVPQISDLGEWYLGFDLSTPISSLSRISFTYEDGTPAYIEGEYLIGYQTNAN